MIFEIDNIELYFQEKRILNGIYLKAETGQVTGILGSNGCGKSCLLNIAFGNLKPKYKLIRIDQKPILKPLYKTQLAAYLPQHHFIPPELKIKTAFKLYKVDWNEFLKDYEQYSIFKNIKFGKLSGGERRVIEIYVTLKKMANIVLLDEPFNGVAPLYIEKIKALIKQERHQKAIILTDHRYTEVIDVCDTIYLLKNGCTKRIDSLKELEDYSYLSEGALSL